MLQTQTVTAETLDILKKIQARDYFRPFRLVGGTALALQLGHRKSIDLDFFGEKEIIQTELVRELTQIGEVKTTGITKYMAFFYVNNLKIDFVNFNYPWLEDAIMETGVMMAKQKDIAAMKIAALTNRGTKKDFVDLYFLLKKFTLRDIIEFYLQKYADGSAFMALKSIIYFEDAEHQPMPEMLVEVSWEQVKAKVAHEHQKLIAKW